MGRETASTFSFPYKGCLLIFKSACQHIYIQHEVYPLITELLLLLLRIHVCEDARAHVCRGCAWGGERSTFGIGFSPSSPVGKIRLELRPLGLAALSCLAGPSPLYHFKAHRATVLSLHSLVVVITNCWAFAFLRSLIPISIRQNYSHPSLP